MLFVIGSVINTHRNGV